MNILIDRELFNKRVNYRFGSRLHGNIATGDLADIVYVLAQEWLDKKEWLADPELDTIRECRIEMKRHIKSQIDFNDPDKSWCIKESNWRWISQQLIIYIVKLVLDRYWDDILEELPSSK